MITISKQILSKAKKVHVNELSKKIEFKVRVIDTALNYLNLKGQKHEVEDLEKALWYLQREIDTLKGK